jgi:gamma-glutamylaminecyclotransferase
MNDIYVFVYGSLCKGLKNHNFLDCSNFIGNFISEKNFHMVTYKKLEFPYLLEGLILETPSTQIKGEIYKVNQTTLNRLDQLEGHPDLYQRKMHKFFNNEDYIEAWVYILVNTKILNFIKEGINENYFLVESGDWIDFRGRDVN